MHLSVLPAAGLGVGEAMSEPVVMPNGNVKVTVILLPEVWDALLRAAERDGITRTDAVNVAIGSYDWLSTMADANGQNLGRDLEGKP